MYTHAHPHRPPAATCRRPRLPAPGTGGRALAQPGRDRIGVRFRLAQCRAETRAGAGGRSPAGTAAGQKRGLRLPGGHADLLPLAVLGRVAAGAPIGADIGLERARRINSGWTARCSRRRPDYLLRVQGDSMIDDGILDGDLVGVQRSADARNGQTVVARIDGELTIKRLQRERRDPAPAAAQSRACADRGRKPGQDFAIEGVYCGLVGRAEMAAAVATRHPAGRPDDLACRAQPGDRHGRRTDRPCRAGCAVAARWLAASRPDRIAAAGRRRRRTGPAAACAGAADPGRPAGGGDRPALPAVCAGVAGGGRGPGCAGHRRCRVRAMPCGRSSNACAAVPARR